MRFILVLAALAFCSACGPEFDGDYSEELDVSVNLAMTGYGESSVVGGESAEVVGPLTADRSFGWNESYGGF